MLDQLEREREITLIEAREKRADYRAASLMSVVMNAFASKEDKSAFTPDEFFAYFRSLSDQTEGAAMSGELTTAQTVDYLKRGFGLLVPTAFRQRVGLPD